MSDVKLAWNWTKIRVQDCLDKGQKHELIHFLEDRYEERFFDPIRCLRRAPGNEHGYGFAVMSLCCLLVETMECYRKGLPSSHSEELQELASRPENSSVPQDYKLQGPFKVKSRDAFVDFFNETQHQRFFPNVQGLDFYKKIRCGLLHQAQTKDGWRIVRTGKFWDESQLTVNRDEFADRLEECWHSYLQELAVANWTSDIWKSARKKIWWLSQVS